MANQFSYQILKDTNQKTVIKLTGQFDGSGDESNVSRIAANTLYGALDANNVPLHTSLSVSNTALPYYNLQVTRINYNVNMPTTGYVELFWNGTTQAPIVTLDRNGQIGDYENGFPSIPNNAVGPNGDIGISTHGATANSSYTIIVELRKDNAMYDRGQFTDPAAFNYGQYSLRP